MSEVANTFTCFGGSCTVFVAGRGPAGTPEEAVRAATGRLLGWHAQFTRFKADSELAALNRDPRERVPVSPIMARFLTAATEAASMTGGLVDATLLDQIEEVGYKSDRLRASLALPLALALAPARQRAGPAPGEAWRRLEVHVSFRRGDPSAGLACRRRRHRQRPVRRRAR